MDANLKLAMDTVKIELESLNKTFREEKYEDSFRIIPHILTDVEKLVRKLEQLQVAK